jgi:hypothetical protein
MDFVWMGALLALWAVVAAMAFGLNRLDAPKSATGTTGGEAS